MADNERYADDIAELWGPREETAVEPLLPGPKPTPSSGNGSTNGNGNGNGAHGFGREQPQDVARLAEAIAGRRLPSATRDDLEAMRTELETTFTQQLAVAIYELTASSNERLATFEDHVNGRLDGVGAAAEERAAEVSAELEALWELVTVLQADIADLRRVVAGRGNPVPRRRETVRRRRGWNSAP